MDNITIIIKTFNRKNALWRLLASINRYYPSVPIIVVDDSKKNYKHRTEKKFNNLNLTYIVTEFDIGLSKGRNILLENIKTEYFVLCDDDFEFDDRTNLEVALDILLKKEVDVVGGTIFNIFRLDSLYSLLWALKKPKRFVDIMKANEIASVYNGIFKIYGNDVELLIDSRYTNYLDKETYNTDIVSNFFVARTKEIKNIRGWQPEEVKVGEHQAFFLRLKQNDIKVLYTPHFGVKHYPQKTIFYNKYRMRSYRMINQSFEALGLNSYKAMDVLGKEVFSFIANR